MFLKQATRLRPGFLFVACLLPLFLAACRPGLDVDTADADGLDADCEAAQCDPADRRGGTFRVCTQNHARSERVQAASESTTRNFRWFRGGDRDESVVRPTAREMREARAMAMAQADILTRGGAALYRNDGSSSNPANVGFPATPGALTLDYAASGDLNTIDGLPHALRLVVYHLSDRAELDRLASHEDGIHRLLEGQYFDAAVKGVRVHHVQPGASGQLLLDRADGGRYVALVAGYDRPHASTGVYVTEYGLGQWKMEGESVLHRTKTMYTPIPLHLQAVLDEQSMAVRDTGAIYDAMRRVTSLTRRQTRYIAVENQPFPLYNISK